MPGYLIRTYALICLLLGGFSSAYGIGLGEADLRSRLGSPLDLSIPIHHLGDLSGQDIRIALSALKDNISGHPLDSMVGSKYQIDFDSDTNSIRLRSDEAVMEPYLAFTLSVRWPRGYLKRDYTLLMDLPAVHKPAQHEIVVSVPAKSSTKRPTEKIYTPAKAPVKTASNETFKPLPPPAQPPASVSSNSDFRDGQYRVARGDSLWRIATRLSRLRDGDHGQWMASVYQNNPQAFIAGRPDILKEAYLLTIPNECTSTRMQLAADGKTFTLSGPAGQVVADTESPIQEQTLPTELTASNAENSPPVLQYDGKDFVSDPYADSEHTQVPLSSLELYSLEDDAQVETAEAQAPEQSPEVALAIETTGNHSAELVATQANRQRVEILEQQLEQALALIEKQNQQSRLFAPQNTLVTSAVPASAELSNPAYLFRAFGWLALGMSMVMGYIMYRDRGGPKMFVLQRNRRKRDFASMLERN